MIISAPKSVSCCRFNSEATPTTALALELTAAFIPLSASSKIMQSLMSALILLAALRNISGLGLPGKEWSEQIVSSLLNQRSNLSDSKKKSTLLFGAPVAIVQ
jgi:hypothetical protein